MTAHGSDDGPPSGGEMAAGGETLAGGETAAPRDEERWFYRRDGRKQGPFAADALRQMALVGELHPTDEVWRHGMPQWLPAAELEDLVPTYVVATRTLAEAARDRSRSQRRWLAGLLIALVATAAWVWLPTGPRSYRRVSGTVTYSDGTPIPLEGMTVRFHSLVRARDADTLPPEGVARVDRESGRFSHVTSRFYGDGLLAGEHKVTLHTADDQPLPETVANADYSDIDRTILRVDAKDSPLRIVVEKP